MTHAYAPPSPVLLFLIGTALLGAGIPVAFVAVSPRAAVPTTPMHDTARAGNVQAAGSPGVEPVQAWQEPHGPAERTYVAFSNNRIGLFAGGVQEVSEGFGVPAIGPGTPDVIGWFHPEDANRDGVVNMDDITAILAAWGRTSPGVKVEPPVIDPGPENRPVIDKRRVYQSPTRIKPVRPVLANGQH